jgi:calcineurin-like phosphoesterase family protein
MVTDEPPLYVVSDVHGYVDHLRAALRTADLIDDDGHWCAGQARLWCLGDYVDRGPDGIGVLDLVMRLGEEAAQVGGSVRALLGNHEIMLMGVRRFGAEQVPGRPEHTSFAAVWLFNGGQAADQERLTEEHIAWLAMCPVLIREGDHLLMHADTQGYLAFGDTVDEINERVATVLASDDLAAWWECFRTVTERGAFRLLPRQRGASAVDELLTRLGGEVIVHGHSTIPESFGIAPDAVTGPHRYADGRALDVDGGTYLGGPLLVVRLPVTAELPAAV